MLAVVPSGLLASVPPANKAKPLPRVGEFVRFLDPITETAVVRLTSLRSNSFLPASTNSFVSVKDRFLVFSSDRGGRLAPYQVDLHSGVVTQLAKPDKLIPESLSLNRRGNSLYFLDGGALQEIMLSTRKVKPLAEQVSSFCEIHGSSSGTPANFAIVRERRLELLNDESKPLAEDVDNFCLVRPGGTGCFFCRQDSVGEREFWYTPFLGAGIANEAVLLAKGRIANPVWTPDGQSLLFLRQVAKADLVISEIHSVNPETRSEQRIAATTQFAAFSPNGDASVFVGASSSKAQPTILLLVAEVQRELTLCEHRASHPAFVSPVFSPDSRRVYFQSDHEGKSALYSVNVEALVEPTPSGDL